MAVRLRELISNVFPGYFQIIRIILVFAFDSILWRSHNWVGKRYRILVFILVFFSVKVPVRLF